MLTKICKTCGVEKPLSEFAKSTVNRLGCIPHCKECKNWEHRSEENKKKELEKQEFIKQGIKRCVACEEILPLEKFPIRESSKDGRKSYCYECQRRKALETSRKPDVIKKRKERESKPGFLENLYEYRRTSEVYQNYVKEYKTREQYK